MLAIEAFSAEGLHVYRHSVSHLYSFHFAAYSLYYAHHLVAYGNARYGSWHASVFYMQVACADAAQRHTHYCIRCFLYFRYLFFNEGELAFLYVCISFHIIVPVIAFFHISLLTLWGAC